MSLAVGSRLGAYEITGQLGRGGMGEVYRARDTRLGRDVAIKVLPSSFASNPDRVARFEREARTLASLNHANVGAIHGVEQTDGTRALVLELIEGPTLADRIARGPLPIAEALAIAKQIADALEAAHETGVVHRDLKPANIKVRVDGTVKVLDFGLAKAFEPVKASDNSDLPTLTSPAQTMQGVVMGTAAYMSPEQAEGGETDQRTDIWSFAVVLYEMLTGGRLFGGDSVQRVMAKVLERDVDLIALPPATPPSIRRLLRRALERDKKRRLRHIADARTEIEEALAGTANEAISVVQPPPARAGSRALTWVLGVLVIVLAVVTGVALWRLTHTDPGPVAQFEITTRDAPPRLGGAYPDLAISPDGTRVVYVSGETNGLARMYLRQSDALEPTPIRGAERGVGPSFSRDGQRVAFIVPAENALKQVSILGGPATTIVTAERAIGGASWGPDDTVVYGGGIGGGLWQVSSNGGEPKMLTTLTGGGTALGHNWPDVLPNGKGVLFTIAGSTPAASRIAVLSLETGAVTELVSGNGQPRYAATGHIVYGVEDSTLRAIGFDQERLAIIGSPVPVLEGVLTKPFGAAVFSIARNGTLVYLKARSQAGVRRELVWVERDGAERHIAFSDGDPSWPRVSPDGTRAVFIASGDVWVCDLARGSLSRVTEIGNVSFVLWHPDGRRVIFPAIREGTLQLFLQSADGTGKAEPFPLKGGVRALSPEGWTADGRPVVSYQSLQTPGFDIGILSAKGDTLEPFLSTPTNEDSFTISPDGRWIAYEADRSGQYEVYVERFPEGGDRRAISAPDGGEDPAWSRDGTELFYRRLKDKAMMVVPITTRPAFNVGASKALFEGTNYFDSGGRAYDVDRDGRRFLTFKNLPATSDAPAPALILVQNFFSELQRLVPAR